MENVAEDLFRFGVALAIGAMIGVERQFSGTRGAVEQAESVPPAPPTIEEHLRAAVAAGEQPPGGAPAPVATAPAPRDPTAGLDRLDSTPAGVRTFTLFALAGGVAAYLGPAFPWLFPAALLVMGALVVAGYQGAVRRGDAGLTSEISSILTFLLGGLAVTGETTIAGACAVAVTALLALKRTLHAFTGKLRQEDILAVLKFAVISVVVLPMLPSDPIRLGDLLDQRQAGAEARASEAPGEPAPAGPKQEDPAPAANAQQEDPDPAGAGARQEDPEPAWWRDISISPRKVWYMVVLISGVSFAGYVLGKVVGTGRGLALTGAVGGLVSSTAVSLSFSQRSAETPDLSPRLGMGILIANAIMPLRLLLIIGVIDLRVAVRLALPLLGMVLVGGLFVLGLHLRRKGDGESVDVPLKNPFEISPALKFGAVFALVLVLAQVAEGLFGKTGMYVLAFLSGLTDVDAIGLALSNQARAARLDVAAAAIGIALAAASNTVVKAGFVVWFGAPRLRRIALAAFGLMLAAAVGGILAVPALFG